ATPSTQVAQIQPEGRAAAEAISAVLAEINATPALLDALLQRQHYRLTLWNHGDTELNYRRFFNIITLAGLRLEDERVLADSHALIRRWLEQGRLEGLRIDHVDGLQNPEQYLQRLRELAPRNWIAVEKILQSGESLPSRTARRSDGRETSDRFLC
ncbi:MAG: hypothetical protein DMG78_32455, partial [Acidobacteria bacterium]